jgi:hypothetical protein
MTDARPFAVVITAIMFPQGQITSRTYIHWFHQVYSFRSNTPITNEISSTGWQRIFVIFSISFWFHKFLSCLSAQNVWKYKLLSFEDLSPFTVTLSFFLINVFGSEDISLLQENLFFWWRFNFWRCWRVNGLLNSNQLSTLWLSRL